MHNGETVEELKQKVISLNRSIGQLQRRNTLWNGWPNDERIREAQWERNQAQFHLKIAEKNVEAAASFAWFGF